MENYAHQMKKAMEKLRWVAFEEYTYARRESEDEEAKANDLTESTETDEKTDEEITVRSSDDENSESAEFEDEGDLKL